LHNTLFLLRLVPAQDHLQNCDSFVEALLRCLAGLDAVDEVLYLADESILRLKLMLLRVLAVSLNVQIIAAAEDLPRLTDCMDLPMAIRPWMSPGGLQGANGAILESHHCLRGVFSL